MDLYEVEKILEKRKIKGNIFYKVKWLDYDDSHNSWEPEANLN